MTKISKLGKKRALLKIFLIDGEIVGAYKRSSIRTLCKINNVEYRGTYVHATYDDLLKAENHIIDPENKYLA